ncbi:MAG: class I SAM-dependent methyltransferase [Patescibacteria group bacterium]|jgi:ubiquinone/menaquinone biosynthesis C-methylase UbiE
MQPRDDKFIYTDGIDYSKTSADSVWGTEEKITSKIIDETVTSGKWLNLCAGDGRFNNRLLSLANQVIAADIDESALEKLTRITPKELEKKLKTKILNVTEKFPFKDAEFDGIFCSGTLHLFPEDILRKIFNEMDRVLKPNGKIVIDYAADIRREYPNGSLWVIENEPNYSLKDAKELLSKMFSNYLVEMFADKSEPERVSFNNKEYQFSSNFILIRARKK